ncbi:MAG: DUF1178 family protein [Burkholderiales bacterium]|jgi:hypothetical protein|nr:MAG: DUF1178 family protein [Burkholderiales bacterium]
MKVLNLHCANDHDFEGWFASDEDFSAQMQRGLVECPLCADRRIERRPSAPRLNLGAPTETRDESTVDVAKLSGAELQAAWLQAVRQVLANTEDVGERFPEEARRIHYGETEQRGIRGKASRDETQALRDEGIEVMPFVIPDALKHTIQ